METPLEQGMPPIDKHWLKLHNLTIYEAAFWMAHGSDPRSHKKRCVQDAAYANHFNERLDDVSDAIERECEVIFSAIYSGFIKTAENVHPNNDDLTTRTRIQKTGWINWCRDNNYPELADLFEVNQEDNNHTYGRRVGMTKQEVMRAFDGLHFSSHRWSKNLASPPGWLLTCRIEKGSKAASASWNPVLIAVELLDKQVSLRKLDTVFIGLKGWTDEWQDKSALYRI